MEEEGIDVYVGTRLKSLTYICGCFIPWRSAVVLPREGDPEIFTIMLDAERIKDESWIKNVTGWGPMKTFELEFLLKRTMKKLGLEGSTIGIDYGQEMCMAGGLLLAYEYDKFKETFPAAKFKSFTDEMDKIQNIKEPEEIALLRRASEVTDAGQAACKELDSWVGLTETQLGGVADQAMRNAGSDWAWTITGGQEIGSGYRTWYSWGGCTPATTKIIQPRDCVLVDLHSMVQLYYGDLSHNYFVGNPTPEQKDLGEAFTEACYALKDAYQAGTKYKDVVKIVTDKVQKRGYGPYLFFGLGHGIGCCGSEAYPIVVDGEPWGNMTLEPDMVEIMAIVLNKPGVGGMRLEAPLWIKKKGNEVLPKTPFEPEVIPA
jgi:Xaa-Pro aminopeptidase